MNATEAKKALCDVHKSICKESHKKAIWIAIRAIDTCTSNGFEVTD